MTLYYSLVFMLLMLEVFLFGLLIIPLPFKLRKKLFSFISENPVVAKAQYWLKITFVFILILFADSVNRVYRVQLELAAATNTNNRNAPTVLGHERLEVQARKFYSQRNMYLCGFTLFLSLILNRTYVFIQEIMILEDKVRVYESNPKTGKGASDDEIKDLKEALRAKNVDIETLRKQSKQLHKEYDALSEKVAPYDDSSKKAN